MECTVCIQLHSGDANGSLPRGTFFYSGRCVAVLLHALDQCCNPRVSMFIFIWRVAVFHMSLFVQLSTFSYDFSCEYRHDNRL